MANKLYEESVIQDIANATKELIGNNAKMVIADIPLKIRSAVDGLPDAGTGGDSSGICPKLTIRPSENTYINNCLYFSNGQYRASDVYTDGNPDTGEVYAYNIDINTLVIITFYDSIGLFDGIDIENGEKIFVWENIYLMKCTVAGEETVAQITEIAPVDVS